MCNFLTSIKLFLINAETYAEDCINTLVVNKSVNH